RCGGARVGRAARRELHRLRAHVIRASRRVQGRAQAHGRARRKGMTMDRPFIFMVVMGAAVLAYVVLDGYDLGVGMLMPAATEQEQSTMVASIGPFWDANETWLVLGIGILLSAFPAAHGIVLTALYLPV